MTFKNKGDCDCFLCCLIVVIVSVVIFCGYIHTEISCDDYAFLNKSLRQYPSLRAEVNILFLKNKREISVAQFYEIRALIAQQKVKELNQILSDADSTSQPIKP